MLFWLDFHHVQSDLCQWFKMQQHFLFLMSPISHCFSSLCACQGLSREDPDAEWTGGIEFISNNGYTKGRGGQTVHTIGQGTQPENRLVGEGGYLQTLRQNGDKVAAQGAPSLALGMVTLEVPKVSQVRRISNQGVVSTEQEPTRPTKTRQQDGQERHNSKSKNLQTMTRGKQDRKVQTKQIKSILEIINWN